MGITKFRNIRLVTVILIWLIVSLISLIKQFAAFKVLDLGIVLLCLSEPCALILIIVTVHFVLKKLLPNGMNKNNRYVNYAVDTLIYIVASAVIYYILIILYCGFVYLLCELGYAPAPQ